MVCGYYVNNIMSLSLPLSSKSTFKTMKLLKIVTVSYALAVKQSISGFGSDNIESQQLRQIRATKLACLLIGSALFLLSLSLVWLECLHVH